MKNNLFILLFFLVISGIKSAATTRLDSTLTAWCNTTDTYTLNADTIADNLVYQWYKNGTLLTDSTRAALVVAKTETATYTCKIDSLDPQIGSNMMGNGSFENIPTGSNTPFSSDYTFHNSCGDSHCHNGIHPDGGFYNRHSNLSGFYVLTKNANSMWGRFTNLPADEGSYYALFDANSEGRAWYVNINDHAAGHELVQGSTYIFSFSAANINIHEPQPDTTALLAALNNISKNSNQYVVAVRMPVTCSNMRWVGESNNWNEANAQAFSALSGFDGWWYAIINKTANNEGRIIYRDNIDGTEHKEGLGHSVTRIASASGVTKYDRSEYTFPNDWNINNAHVYIWHDGGDITTAWPGDAISPVSGRSFEYNLNNIENYTNPKVIWNDNSSHQSDNLEFCHCIRVTNTSQPAVLMFNETDSHPAKLQFTITNNENGEKAVLGTIDLDCKKGTDTHHWQREQYVWPAKWSTTDFTIAVEDVVSDPIGNDFALDRIMFQMRDEHNYKSVGEDHFNIVALPIKDSTENYTICDSLRWHDVLYTATPSVAPVHVVQSAFSGCDSIRITLNLTINDGSMVYKKWDDMLVCANREGNITSYQWYAAGKPIEGATQQYYLITDASLLYSVVATTRDGEQRTSCSKLIDELGRSADAARSAAKEKQQATKRLVNGQLLIEYNGQLYNALGSRL